MKEQKDRLRSDVQRGENARLILENPVFQEAMKLMRDEIVSDWSKCPIRDVEGQKLYLQLHKLSTKFENTLVGLVENGKLAQFDLDKLRDESKAQTFFRRVL